MLKQNPTNLGRVYMSVKQDRGINVAFPRNEKNWKEYFFYVSGLWESPTRVMIRNMCSFIMMLSPDAKQCMADIHNYFLEKTLWRHLLNTLHFVTCGLMTHGLVEPSQRIIRKP